MRQPGYMERAKAFPERAASTDSDALGTTCVSDAYLGSLDPCANLQCDIKLPFLSGRFAGPATVSPS